LLNFGKGAGAGLVLGGTLHGGLGWETRFTYVAGSTNKTEYHSTDGTYTDKHQNEARNSYLRFEPALRFTVGEGPWRWYAAVGPSIALFNKLVTKEYDVSTSTSPFSPYSHSTETEIKYTGRFGIGGFGAFGFVYQGSHRVGFFGEVNYTAQTWSPAHSEYTSYKENGLNSLAQLTTSERETDYADSFTKPDTDPNKPGTGSLLRLPMSTFGLRIGLHIRLGAKAVAQ
jgi:hypothetical protein